MKQVDLRECIRACTAASNRSRYVLLMMVLASVVAFTSFWTHVDFGWSVARAKRAHEAVSAPDAGEPDGVKGDTETPSGAKPDAGESGARADEGAEQDEGAETPAEPNHTAEPNGIDVLALERYRASLDRRTARDDVVDVPFLGVWFDINDLGFMAGLAFCVIMLWFRFACVRERRNLQFTFDEARRQGSLGIVYDELAMWQVVTVPDDADPHRSPRSVLPKLLIVLPSFVYALIVTYDGMSIAYAWAMSPEATVIGAVARVFAMVFVIWGSAASAIDQDAIDRLWSQTFVEVQVMRRERDQSSASSILVS